MEGLFVNNHLSAFPKADVKNKDLNMNPEWFGDSYDIVKRFFVEVLKSCDYEVHIDPLFTGDWRGAENSFYEFVGASKAVKVSDSDNFRSGSSGKRALLLDPDTGIGKKRSDQHIKIEDVAEYVKDYDIVFSFDQSFSRSKDLSEQMQEKLGKLSDKGISCFYYNSHAKFLFASKKRKKLLEVRKAILAPVCRNLE